MCRIYSSTDPTLYTSTTRSVRINGHVTSVRLEQEFWNILETIAAESGLSTAQFITTLHDEVLEERRRVDNFTSMLRVICTLYLARKCTLTNGEFMPAPCPPESREHGISNG